MDIQFANIEECECCHEWVSIYNFKDGNNYIELINNQFLCIKCK